MTGIIFDIKRYAIHDGPGIRTTVFLKGCSLRCAWCHSPESQALAPELMFLGSLCAGCGACRDACPLGLLDAGPTSVDRSACTACGACARVCYSGALTLVGREIGAAELAQELLRDELLHQVTRGGVTISGGEPALQPAFVAAVIDLLKAKGAHTAVETAGNVPWPDLWEATRAADLVLFDFKHHAAEAHRRWTGAGNDQIVGNLLRLSASFAATEQQLIVRIPLIPGVNDDPATLAGMASLLTHLPRLDGVEVLPYHNLGTPKYEATGRGYTLGDVISPNLPALREVANIFAGQGIEVRLESEGPR